MLWPYRILLLLNVAYCCVGLITNRIPAWRMFEKVEPLELQIRDSQGKPVEIRDYLPAGAYLNELNSALPVIEFICELFGSPLRPCSSVSWKDSRITGH